MSTFIGPLQKSASSPPGYGQYYTDGATTFQWYSFSPNSFTCTPLAQSSEVQISISGNNTTLAAIYVSVSVSSNPPDVNGNVLTSWALSPTATRYFVGGDPVITDPTTANSYYSVEIIPILAPGGGSSTPPFYQFIYLANNSTPTSGQMSVQINESPPNTLLISTTDQLGNTFLPYTSTSTGDPVNGTYTKLRLDAYYQGKVVQSMILYNYNATVTSGYVTYDIFDNFTYQSSLPTLPVTVNLTLLGVNNLGDLADVRVGPSLVPTNGEVLRWNTGLNAWVLSSAGTVNSVGGSYAIGDVVTYASTDGTEITDSGIPATTVVLLAAPQILTNKVLNSPTNTVSATQLNSGSNPAVDAVVLGNLPSGAGLVLTSTSSTGANWSALSGLIGSGVGTLSSSTVTISNSSVKSTSKILLTYQNITTSIVTADTGALYISAIVPNTSFTVASTQVSDNSSFYWLIVY